MSPVVSVLFVCLGNICRSPTAQGIFQHRVDQAGLAERIAVDSAGTGDWHLGSPPDRRAQSHALRRGYDLSSLRARQVTRADFQRFDYILAMDRQNMRGLNALMPDSYAGRCTLFLDYLNRQEGLEVPDPYYGGDEGFERVLDMIELASSNLLDEISTLHFQ